jgi:hypothetical protein
MTLYVTPAKYRTMGFGIDLDDPDDAVEDFELAAILDRSGAIAEGYCAVPTIPRKHSFLGGEITTTAPEQHPWRIPENDFDIGSRRVYLYHWPIKEVTQFRVKVTNTQYVELAPSEIFINNTERYIEVISLAFTGVGLFGAILPSLGLMRPVAEIAYKYGRTFEQPEERLYPTDARTYRGLNQFWFSSPAPSVEVNGAVQTTGYSVDHEEGTVIFDTPLAVGAKASATYSFPLPPEIRDAIGLIATHLLGERELQKRGMEGVDSIKVGEVTIKKSDPKLSAENIDYFEPEAAWLLNGFKFPTVR